jgi:hypothetical protein
MQVLHAEQTGSDSPWDIWSVSGTHERGPWSMTILVEQDGRDIEVDKTEGLSEEEAQEAVVAWQIWLEDNS